MNSKVKGKRGELEASKVLRGLGIDARRGQQFSGGTDSPDVVTDLPGVHFEIKRVERLNIDNAIAQATRDCGDQIPVVMHRRNRGDWMLTVKMDDLMGLVDVISGHDKTNK